MPRERRLQLGLGVTPDPADDVVEVHSVRGGRWHTSFTLLTPRELSPRPCGQSRRERSGDGINLDEEQVSMTPACWQTLWEIKVRCGGHGRSLGIVLVATGCSPCCPRHLEATIPKSILPMTIFHPMRTPPLGTSEADSVFWMNKFENRLYQQTTRHESRSRSKEGATGVSAQIYHSPDCLTDCRRSPIHCPGCIPNYLGRGEVAGIVVDEAGNWKLPQKNNVNAGYVTITHRRCFQECRPANTLLVR